MEFEIEHELPCPAEHAWKLIFSHEFEAELDRVLNKAVRETISEEMEGSVQVRTIRVEMNEQLPPVLVRVLGNPELGYILEDLPEATFSGDGRVDLYAYISAVVALAQEQQAEIDHLKEQVKALKAGR